MRVKRVYKFYSRKWGFEALEKRRLKVSTIEDLNDPFEFQNNTSENGSLRRAWHSAIADVFERNGLISFSREWKNPVLWSHYADSHRGIALGFDVVVSHLAAVEYTSTRRELGNIENLSRDQKVELIKRATRTKFSHWSYEDEERIFVRLDKIDPNKKMYFYAFSSEMTLREVILGPRFMGSSEEIRKLLNPEEDVEIQTTRLAFKSYSVVPQNNRRLQK